MVTSMQKSDYVQNQLEESQYLVSWTNFKLSSRYDGKLTY